jgi:hypothetical protein
MIRDDELNRLTRYAQGMGVSVRFKESVPGSPGSEWAEWSDRADGANYIVTIFTSPGDSKICHILCLIHELGHHKGFVHNGRRVPPAVVEAIEDESEKKSSRKKIYEDEVADMQHWHQIYKDTDCRFNINKLYRCQDYDAWAYKMYYEKGSFPTEKECVIKRRQLKAKYGC